MFVIADILFVAFVALMTFLGVRKGFLTKAWWLLDLALIVILAVFFMSPVLEKMSATSLYASLISKLTPIVEKVKLSPDTVVRAIFGTGFCILLGIGVIVVMAIVKLLLRLLLRYKWFRIVDKVFGGIYSACITVAVLMALGVVAGTFACFAPVGKAYDFCSDSYVFGYIFGKNPFQAQMNANCNIGQWIFNLIYH